MSDDWIRQMRKGVAEVCVLAACARREAYGHDLLKRLQRHPRLAIGESTLYLLLARLQKEGFVAGRAIKSSKGPPRRYFRLTAKGRERLADMAAFWHGFSEEVSAFIAGAGGEDEDG